MKASSSSSFGSSGHDAQQALVQLRAMFPDCDPGYLESAISSYPSRTPENKIVAKVAHKMLELNHGHWPTVVMRQDSKLKPRSGNTKGKGRALSLEDGAHGVDETVTRNMVLIHLNEMFPAIDTSILRQALTKSKHSYAYHSLAYLLNDGALAPDAPEVWAKIDKKKTVSHKRRQNPGEMSHRDLLRDAHYVECALELLIAQFPSIWKSSLKAVMAENNFDYFSSVEAAKRLQEEQPNSFVSKIWSAMSRIFSTSPSSSSARASNKLDLHSAEFDLRDYLTSTAFTSSDGISPTLAYEIHIWLTQSTKASRTTRKPVPGESATPIDPSNALECGCCFSDLAASAMAQCTDGCLFCKTCVSRTIEETVFGQAPIKLLCPKTENATEDAPDYGAGMGIRCLSIEGCQAAFSDKELRRSLSEHLYQSLERRIAQETLRNFQISQNTTIAQDGRRKEITKLVQCPFCSYVELSTVVQVLDLLDFRDLPSFLGVLAAVLLISFLFLSWTLASLVLVELLNVPSRHIERNPTLAAHTHKKPLYFALEPGRGLSEIQHILGNALERIALRRNGNVFRCRNIANPHVDSIPTTKSSSSPAYIYSLLPPPPVSSGMSSSPILNIHGADSQTCGRSSCLLCGKLHYAGHECSDSLDGLRLAMEAAASNAVKRQCPECGLSFVKLDGCNKVVCRCGYAMCFVCRKGIGAERYAHFCQHVRDPPGSACDLCTKCDLYKTDDDAQAAKRAATQAKATWLKAHPEHAGNSKTDAMQSNLEPDLTTSVRNWLEDQTELLLALLV